MKLKVGIAAFAAWLVIGVTVTLLYYNKKRSPDMSYTGKQIQKITSQNQTSGHLIDALPGLFDRESALAAAFVTNRENQLMGSMYEPKRMPRETYRTMVKSLSQILNEGNKTQYRLTRIDSGGPFLVYLASHRSRNYGQIWQGLRHSVAGIHFFLGGYILIGSGILLFIVFALLKNNPERPPMVVKTRKKKQKKEKKARADVAQPNPQPDEGVAPAMRNNNNSLLFNNQLVQLMNDFYTYFPYLSLVYYSREQQGWQPVMQKKGQVFIKGQVIPDIPGAFAAVQNLQTWKDPVKSPDGLELILPVRRRERLIGAFYFLFSPENRLPGGYEIELQKEVSRFARSLFVQKSYQDAVLDDESVAVTYPYFYFALKERLLSSSAFATLIMCLDTSEAPAADQIKRWSMAIHQLLKTDEADEHTSIRNKHLLARIDERQFAIVFDLNRLDFQEALEISNKIEQITNTLLGLNVHGALVIRPADLNHVDHYLRRLQYGLQRAVEQRTFGVQLKEPGAAGVL